MKDLPIEPIDLCEDLPIDNWVLARSPDNFLTRALSMVDPLAILENSSYIARRWRKLREAKIKMNLKVKYSHKNVIIGNNELWSSYAWNEWISASMCTSNKDKAEMLCTFVWIVVPSIVSRSQSWSVAAKELSDSEYYWSTYNCHILAM